MVTKRKQQKSPKKGISKLGIYIALVYALYLSFILLSRLPLVAELWIEPKMEDTYEVQLSFTMDGKQSHYDVERYDQNVPGNIYVKYFPANNTLNIEVANIKTLGIDCRSLFEDEYKEVFGIAAKDDSNYYKRYFIEKDHLKVHLDSEHNITRIEFTDAPMPYEVRINNEVLFLDVDYSYSNNYGTIISNVPKGHSWVDIYFQSPGTTCPVASFNVTDTTVEVFKQITFDASASTDPDGKISNFFWDFGDGSFVAGTETVRYQYSNPGTYNVILTVRDDDHLLDRAYEKIIILPESSQDDIPSIKKRIPDLELVEDFEPTSLDLNEYESIIEQLNNPLKWWVTGENSSLYTVVGENSSADTLLFSPVANAYGNDRLTIWLGDNRGVIDNQDIWINITSVNDVPTIFGSPDLVVHYDEYYIFNFNPYVNDVETRKEDLLISTSDPEHAEILDGLKVSFKYPKSMLGETTYVIITVSDGEDISEDVITITVSDDWVPILINELPDIYLMEGETKYNYFNLDDYYSDPDGDALFFSYGNTKVDITIHDNHSVDFKAPDDWWGHEVVTFRATDPVGAKAEDIIRVNVEEVNDAPVIEGVPNIVVHYDHPYNFDLLPYVSDEDNDLNELIISTSEHKDGDWIDSDENGYIQLLSNNNLILVINYPKTYLEKTVLVDINVSDGEISSSQLISIWITSNYPPELVQPLPYFTFFEDSSLSRVLDLTKYFLDRDFDDLYYSYGEVNINVTINIDGTVDLSSEKDWYGSEFVTFRATDPVPYNAFAEDTMIITVIPVNDAPVVDMIPTQKGKLGETWSLDLIEYIHDVDNELTELNITIDADDLDCQIKGTELIIYGTSAIRKTIEIEVSDGIENTTQSVLVVITQPPEVEGDLLVINFMGAVIVLIIVSVALVSYRKYQSNYIVEEIFLIHKCGVLINHKSRELEVQVDEDILSGMFTVVQGFIKESFATRASKGEDWALDELKMGQNKILIDRGRFVYLTVIFSGPSLAGKKLRKRTKTLLNTIEKQYAKYLKDWSGNMADIEDIDDELTELLPDETKLEDR